MFTRFILITLFFCGCATVPPQTSIDQPRAERIARQFAVQHLGLTETQVAKMKAELSGLGMIHGNRLTIQLYDPTVFHLNSDGFIEAMDGGFPSYFTVTVDIHTWRVVDHYAGPL